MRTLIAKTAAAATAEFEVFVNPNSQPCAPVTLYVTGGAVAGGQAIAINYADDSGASRAWRQLKKGNVDVVLNPENNFVVIDFPGIFQVSKGAAAGDLGVDLA